MFLKLVFAILFNISLPYLLTIFLQASSTAVEALICNTLSIYLDSFSISFKNIYLLIIEEQPTDKHLSSAFVVNVIFL